MIRDISFEITQRCLNNCVHCSSCSNSLCKQHIDYATICKTVDDMPHIGVKRVCLSGGEPFLHIDLKKIVTYIKQMDMEVNIYSSGITEIDGQITYITTDEFKDLKERGLSKIMFNLQSYDSSRYDEIMGTTCRFDIVKASIKNAIEAGIYTEIHFVPMKINVDDIDGIVELARKMNVNKVSFLKLVPHGRADKNKQLIQLSEEETIKLRNKLSGIKSEAIRIGIPLSLDFDSDFCHAASSKLYIKFDGTVYGCEAFKYIQQLDGESNVIQPNNIFESSLLDIYNNSKYLKATQEFVKKYSCFNSKCESCPVQKYLEAKGEK
ncbi:MAG: radical SAM protein [Lachnospiraceae bacterium]|nr:radical SAM protein [Lachnospiraceae bacterium]